MSSLDLDLLATAGLVDELRRRISSARVDTHEAERIAREILGDRGWEEALALLAAVATRVLARVAASWEHPCHCDPGRVSQRIRLLYAALAAVSQQEAERLAAEACREASRECRIPSTMYT